MKRVSKSMTRWVAIFRSWNADGSLYEHVIFDDCTPRLFGTRREAREWIEEKYGYIKVRRDLRVAPNRWRFPRTAKAVISIKTIR